MKKFRANVFKISVLMLTVSQLISNLTSFNLLNLAAFFALISLIFGFGFLNKLFRIVTLIFSLISFVLLILDKQPLIIWQESLNRMGGIITILTVMQLFMIPIESGHYDKTINYFLENKLKSPQRLFGFIMVMSTIFILSYKKKTS